MKRSILVLAVLTLLLSGVGQAKAGIAVTFDDQFGQQLGNGPFTLGWQFQVNNNITVTQLGVFDDALNGLGQSHEVGIWDSLGNLLTSTTVGAGTSGTLINQFRYANTAAANLTAGETYTIGAVWLDGTDPMIFGNTTNFNTDPSITFLNSSFVNGGSLTDPIIPVGPDPAYFGPNFAFGAAAVPEPASMTLLGLGAFSLAGYGWRRRKAQTVNT